MALNGILAKLVEKFSEENGFPDLSESEKFERYVAYLYLRRYAEPEPEKAIDAVTGDGEDEGIDVAAVVIDDVLFENRVDLEAYFTDTRPSGTIGSAKVIFIQVKASPKIDTKLVSKFLHGVRIVADAASQSTFKDVPRSLKEVANMLAYLLEEILRIKNNTIGCELYYVTTRVSSEKVNENQVRCALEDIVNTGVFLTPELAYPGTQELNVKAQEDKGPKDIVVSIPHITAINIEGQESVEALYVGLIKGDTLRGILLDEDNELRPYIFDRNVRQYLGEKNHVNREISNTLRDGEVALFPLLNNGIVVVGDCRPVSGNNFKLSNYQIINGAQTCHEIANWCRDMVARGADLLETYLKGLFIPIKLVSTKDSELTARVSRASNRQSAISEYMMLASLEEAIKIEDYFRLSKDPELRFVRQTGEKGDVNVAKQRHISAKDLTCAVASAIFGDSYRAIREPKTLAGANSPVWFGCPETVFLFSAFIYYRVDLLFKNYTLNTSIKAARYHLIMMAALFLVPELADLVHEPGCPVESEQEHVRRRLLQLSKGNKFTVSPEKDMQVVVDEAITKSANLLLKLGCFNTVLEGEERNLRKDDVRTREIAVTLRNMVKKELMGR